MLIKIDIHLTNFSSNITVQNVILKNFKKESDNERRWNDWTRSKRPQGLPKMRQQKYEVRNYDMMWHDGDVHCADCGTYIRMYDAG